MKFRNPLTVVKGFLQLYEKDSSYSNDSKKHFVLMIDELNAAEQVISQFPSIAKPNKEAETAIVNVKAVLQSVTDLLYSYGLLHANKAEKYKGTIDSQSSKGEGTTVTIRFPAKTS